MYIARSLAARTGISAQLTEFRLAGPRARRVYALSLPETYARARAWIFSFGRKLQGETTRATLLVDPLCSLVAYIAITARPRDAFRLSL